MDWLKVIGIVGPIVFVGITAILFFVVEPWIVARVPQKPYREIPVVTRLQYWSWW